MNLKEGDQVITVPFTFIASAASILYTGARPAFVDVDESTFNMDPSLIEAAITPRTKAIMPVSLYGNPAELPAIAAIAERYGLALVEDAAQAHGAAIDGRRSGSWGIGAFSFYPTKNMTTGEGGMVVCRDDATARTVRLLRNQGMEQRYRNVIAGLNNRMTDLAAAMGRVQLRRLAGWNEERRAIAASYDELSSVWAGLPEPMWVELPGTKLGGVTVLFLRDPDNVVVELVERPAPGGRQRPTPG